MKLTYSDEAQSAPLPSFRVWLRTLPKDGPSPVKVVRKVWFPNQFPNFALETESYRLRIPANGAASADLEAEFLSSFESEEVLVIRVIDPRSASFEVETLEGERGIWTALGAYGHACEVQAKKSKALERATKKPRVEGAG